MSARAPRLGPWIIIPVAGLVAVVTFAVVSFAAYGAGGPYPWPWWGFFPWFPFVGIGIFFGFLFLVFVFRGFGGPWSWGTGYRGADHDTSGTILRERYARGEITAQQFDEMRRDLDQHLSQNAYEGELGRRAGP